MILGTDIWKFTESYYKISTDKKRLRNRLKLIGCSISEVYMKDGKEIAWGLMFEKKKLSKVKTEVKQFEKEAKQIGKRLKDARDKKRTKKSR